MLNDSGRIFQVAITSGKDFHDHKVLRGKDAKWLVAEDSRERPCERFAGVPKGSGLYQIGGIQRTRRSTDESQPAHVLAAEAHPVEGENDIEAGFAQSRFALCSTDAGHRQIRVLGLPWLAVYGESQSSVSCGVDARTLKRVDDGEEDCYWVVQVDW